jgi:hypothetical protein
LYAHRWLGLPVRESFYILQFTLAFLLGPLFYRFLRQLKFSLNWSRAGVLILFSAYPIMAAHFEPVHTWDDFWVYIFLVLTFTFITRKRLIYSLAFFTLACFAREQSLLFYPVIVLAVFLFFGEMSMGKKILYLLAPLIIYGTFYVIVYQPPADRRFELIVFNFENALRTRDSIFSFYISFGFVWVASIISLVRLARAKKSRIISLLFWGALITFPLNVPLTFFIATARETRIFFPPFVFLIPLSLISLQWIYEFIRGHFSIRRQIIALIAFHALMLSGVFLAKQIFPYFEYRQCASYCQEWAGINLGITVFLLAVYILYSKKISPAIYNQTQRSKSESSSNS